MLLLIESLIGIALFTLIVIPMDIKDPLAVIGDYPPEIRKRCEQLGLIEKREKRRDADCVSRSFCPKLSVSEDPVCGSAHCQIADYWAGELGKQSIKAYQASPRGGCLFCEKTPNGRISISGEAVLVAVTDIVAEL